MGDERENVRVNELEIVRSGDVAEFLEKNYLREPSLENPFLSQVPRIINQILAPVLTENYIQKDKKGRLRTEITGSVGRWLTEEKVHPGFWKYPPFFAQQAMLEQDGETRRLLKHLSHGPADLDIKIDPKRELKGNFSWCLLEDLLNRRNRENYNFENFEYQEVNGSHFIRNIQMGEFNLELNFGPIPTNPDRERIEIKFFDPQEAERIIFLCHLGYLPTEAEDAIADKRLGETCDKQDYVTARLESDGKNLTYYVTKQAKEVMGRPDRFARLDALRKRSSGDLLELGFRALRINLLHPFEYEKDVDLILSLFSTSHKDGSIFDFRQAVQGVVLKKEPITENIKKVVSRELFLSLTIDPYLTILFLRDSSIASLIPGLKNLSREDWNNILNDPHLTLTLEDGIRSTIPGPGHLRKQADFYRENRYLDGAERFVNTLGDLDLIEVKEEGSCWQKLKRLFKERREASRERTGLILSEKVLPVPSDHQIIATLSTDFGEMHITLGRGLNTPKLAKLRDELITSLFGKDRKIDLIEALGTYQLNGSRREIEEDLGLIVDIFNKMSSFPGGLTAREIARLTIGEGGDKFAEHLLLLKLAGIIYRHPVGRKSRTGRVVRTDFYCLSSDFSEQTKVKSFYDRRRYIEAFSSISGSSTEPINYFRAFSEKGIDTIEALASLTEEDFQMMGNVEGIGGPEACYIKANQLLKSYQELLEANP